MRALLLLLLWGLSLLSASGQPVPSGERRVNVWIQTQPAGAGLYDQYGSYLGLSGQPVRLDAARYGAVLEVQVRHPDYEEALLTLKAPELVEGARLPARPLKLQPKQNVRLWLQGQAGPALGFLSVGAALGLLASRRRAEIRERQRRTEILSEVDLSDSLAAQKLGRWRLLQRLGRGGMATVYRAVPDATLDESQAVAVKVLRRDMSSDPEFLERFRREARLTSQLDHPHIVRVLDWGEENGYSYLAMELLEGGTLRQRLQGQAVEPAEAWSALEPLCEALIYAHSQGIVHRDLKPENLMITASGLLKVTDFGLARGGDQQQKITRTGTALGTPAYMPPEQIHGDAPIPAMDQYALGVIAYELLTGQLPFADSDPVRLIFKTLTEAPVPPSQRVELPRAVDAVILRMLAKNPGDRFADLRQAAKALEQVLAN